MAKKLPKGNQGKNNAAKSSTEQNTREVVTAPESEVANIETVENNQTTQDAKKVESKAKATPKNTVSKEKPSADAQRPSFRAQAETPKVSKSVKKSKDGKPRKNIFKRMFNGIKSIISELKKVTWPKGKSVASNTLIVLVFVVVFLLVIFVFDYVLTGLLSLLMGNGWVSLF